MIPVLDVRSGRAVRAVAGDRAHYGPLRSVLHEVPDPTALARLGRDAWGLPDLYLADLGAIAGAPPDLALYRAIAGLGLTLWLDAGVRGPDDVPALLDAGVGRVVVGLETIPGPVELAGVVDAAGPDRAVFGLDLRDGAPMVETRAAWGTADPEGIALRAIEAGARRLILLDVARVGTGRGAPAPPWLAGPAGGPGVEWIVGGGIAGRGEIEALARLGAGGVLVGSALHDGRIGPEDLEALREPGGPDRPGDLGR